MYPLFIKRVPARSIEALKKERGCQKGEFSKNAEEVQKTDATRRQQWMSVTEGVQESEDADTGSPMSIIHPWDAEEGYVRVMIMCTDHIQILLTIQERCIIKK
ncbi:hypothetical protein NDU88_005404 [Pleurodeles waltl]|uniref:Uncharacterized protein n=1 Tax=Pleurodeles waltl TaxID=8319 RepID=A0AAV7MGS6_PLEWA|nr:hypothetical protein NDU88_005404 [Pleurodeles waltl]